MSRNKSSRGNGNHPIIIANSSIGRKSLAVVQELARNLSGRLLSGRFNPQRSLPGIYDVKMDAGYNNKYVVAFKIRDKKMSQKFMFVTHIMECADIFYSALHQPDIVGSINTATFIETYIQARRL